LYQSGSKLSTLLDPMALGVIAGPRYGAFFFLQNTQTRAELLLYERDVKVGATLTDRSLGPGGYGSARPIRSPVSMDSPVLV
jgi:hypothetical protein